MRKGNKKIISKIVLSQPSVIAGPGWMDSLFVPKGHLSGILTTVIVIIFLILNIQLNLLCYKTKCS